MTHWRAAIRVEQGDFRLEVELSSGSGVLAVIGPSGSGKSTLLKCIAGAIAADDAEVEVAGRVLESTSERINEPMEQRRIGYLPQGYALFPHLNVLDNVAFGLSTGAGRLRADERRQLAMTMLDRVGCSQLASRSIGGLSGGEQQRVALARALVLKPDLLLLDEPLSALDATSRRAVRSFLAQHLADYGRPAVIVTHDERDVEALADHVAVIEDGRIVQSGSLDSLRAAPASAFVAEFAHAPAVTC